MRACIRSSTCDNGKGVEGKPRGTTGAGRGGAGLGRAPVGDRRVCGRAARDDGCEGSGSATRIGVSEHRVDDDPGSAATCGYTT